MTRTPIGTDDSDDGDRRAQPILDFALHKYEEDQQRRAVVREARKITRDAAGAEQTPKAGPPADASSTLDGP